jgi:hypothetical protein
MGSDVSAHDDPVDPRLIATRRNNFSHSARRPPLKSPAGRDSDGKAEWPQIFRWFRFTGTLAASSIPSFRRLRAGQITGANSSNVWR